MPGGYKGHQGRKPKASTIVERQRQQQRSEPQQRRAPTAPAHLMGVAKAEWRRMSRLLRDAGLLTALDTVALAAYCMAYARHVEAEGMLQGSPGNCPNCDPRNEHERKDGCSPPFHLVPEYGMVIKDRRGKTGPSPYISIANQAMSQMLRLLGEFGMTPASRSRIPKEKEPKQPAGPTPGFGWPEGEAPVDPRDALTKVVQAAKN
jgi:phage terminase small subunit